MEIDFKFIHKESAERFNMEWPDWREKFMKEAVAKSKKCKESQTVYEEFSDLDSGGSLFTLRKYYWSTIHQIAVLR